jgi:hypothetical protein
LLTPSPFIGSAPSLPHPWYSLSSPSSQPPSVILPRPRPLPRAPRGMTRRPPFPTLSPSCLALRCLPLPSPAPRRRGHRPRPPASSRSTNRRRRAADRRRRVVDRRIDDGGWRIDDDGYLSPRALTVEDGRSSGSTATGGATAPVPTAETGRPPRRQWSGSGLAGMAAATLSSREPTVTLG